MNQFDKYIRSNDPIISEAAENMNIATADYKAGKITKAEYDELCEDICDIDAIVSQLFDMVRFQLIYDTFSALLKISSLI